MKLLVVTPEPIDAAFLRSTLDEDIQGAEVLVLSPASNQSKLAFWVSDPDDAIAEAHTAQTDSVERRAQECGVDRLRGDDEQFHGVALPLPAGDETAGRRR